jgi:uncharacterized protein YndB with AHSA1/START domain
VVIDAAPDEVFDSMTQPEQFRRWFGANVDIEPYVGSRTPWNRSSSRWRQSHTRAAHVIGWSGN